MLCIKLLPRLICSPHLHPSFSHLLVSLAIPSWLCHRHGNPSLQRQVWLVCRWLTSSNEADERRSRRDPFIHHFIFLWGSKVTEFTRAYTWLPPPPGYPPSSPTPPSPAQQRSESIKSHIRDQCDLFTAPCRRPLNAAFKQPRSPPPLGGSHHQHLQLSTC